MIELYSFYIDDVPIELQMDIKYVLTGCKLQLSYIKKYKILHWLSHLTDDHLHHEQTQVILMWKNNELYPAKITSVIKHFFRQL